MAKAKGHCRAHAGGRRGRRRIRRRQVQRQGHRREVEVDKGDIALAGFFAAHDLPDGVEPSLDSDATYDPDNFSFPHGTHLVRDGGRHRDRAGRRSARTSASTTSARCVNPLIVEGQVHGGLAQGIAQALFEEANYDEQGNAGHRHVRRLHCCPSAARPAVGSPPTAPKRRRRRNPLGAKGVGEAGTIASTPAVVNAVIDAVRRFGVDGHRDAADPDAGLARHPEGTAPPTRAAPAGGEELGGGLGSIDAAARGGRCAVIPASFDYVPPVHSGRSGAGAVAAAGEDAKVLAGGQSLLPVLRMRTAAPTALIDLRRDRGAARRIRDDGDRIVDRRDGAAPRRHARRPREAARRRCWPWPRRRWRTTRSGTAGPSAGRSRTPTRPATCGGVALALEAEFVIAGPGRHADGRRRTSSSSTTSPPRSTEDEILTEVRFPKYTGWGSHYEKFNRTAQSWSMVGDRRGRPRSRAATIAEAQGGADEHGRRPRCGPAVSRRPWSGSRPRPTRCARRPSASRRAPPHRATPTPRPTTVSTSPGCSPAVRCSPRRADGFPDARSRNCPSTGRPPRAGSRGRASCVLEEEA